MNKAIAAAALLFAACTPQYDPCFPLDSEVKALQILAVRTDPPQAVLNADGTAPPVTVQALVVDPSALNGVEVDVSAATCVPTDTRRCASAPAPAAHGLPGPHSFTVAPPRELLAEALAADPLHGYGGIRVQLDLSATEEAQSAAAEKLLLYAPQGTEPNHGFEITGVRVRRFAFTFHEDMNIPLPPADQVLLPGETLRVDVGDPVWLEPILAPGPGATEAQEVYETTTLDGNRVRLREQIGYTFYATPHSELDPAQSSEPDPGVERPPFGLARYRFLKMRGGAARIYVVARDSRGAQAFLEVPVFASDLRACVEASPPHCPPLETRCL